MTEKQMKTYKTKCEIEYSQEYLPGRDITIVFEDTSVWSKDVNGKPEKFVVRERITGFYHGEPTEDGFKNYYTSGTYKTKCEIEYSQEYLPGRDITLIFEDTYVWSKTVDGEPEKFMVRERITGFYHGEPDEDGFKSFYSKGCEAVMDDELMEALTNTHGDISGDDVKEPKYDYSVVVYGGFDETPLIRYQRTYDDKDQALEVYHELEDTFRLEHKIFDNNTEDFIAQEDCSSMAVIRSGAFDDERVVYFRSLVDNTNYEDYTEDFSLIIKYFQEHNMMS